MPYFTGQSRISRRNNRGAVAPLMAAMMVPLMGLLAFAIDYGFLLYVETNLQRVSDQAALAGVRDLIPEMDGSQDLDRVRQTVRNYVELNLGGSFSVRDEDIEIGRFNPSKIYSEVELFDNGVLDTVRVTLRRDEIANASVSLFFARMFGTEEAAVSAQSTAVLQKAAWIGPGSKVFPFSIQHVAWSQLEYGDSAIIYGDGKISDDWGNTIPGNWGTLDIGPSSNSTNDLNDQIVNGIKQSDLDALFNDGRISTNEYIDASVEVNLQADTGLSAGLKHALHEVEGLARIAPIYLTNNGRGGNNLEFTVDYWVALTVGACQFKGSKNSSVQVYKSYIYDEHLRPNPDLSNIDDVIEGAYTSPVLVE